MGELKDWLDQDWVRIGTDGKIKGKCGTSKNKKNPDRCLPRKKAQSLSKSERAATAMKKKRRPMTPAQKAMSGGASVPMMKKGGKVRGHGIARGGKACKMR